MEVYSSIGAPMSRAYHVNGYGEKQYEADINVSDDFNPTFAKDEKGVFYVSHNNLKGMAQQLGIDSFALSGFSEEEERELLDCSEIMDIIQGLMINEIKKVPADLCLSIT